MVKFALAAAAAASLLSVASCQGQAIVYLIRHGEKPSSGNGLSQQGEERAQCLKTVFGASSMYDIGHIMAETPQPNGTEQRPYDTVEPLAESLNMEVDTSCSRDDAACVADVVDNYSGTGNILICWEHTQLTAIVEALGDSNAAVYPGSDYNLIWTDPYPYSNVTDITSEDCPGLDN